MVPAGNKAPPFVGQPYHKNNSSSSSSSSSYKLKSIGTYEIDKISLSCFDDKRYKLNDGIHTLPYFHKDSDSQKKLRPYRDIVVIDKDCDNGKLL